MKKRNETPNISLSRKQPQVMQTHIDTSMFSNTLFAIWVMWEQDHILSAYRGRVL